MMSECAVCEEGYAVKKAEPVALSCGHTFCRQCLLQVEQKPPLLCPMCRLKHQGPPVSALAVIYALTADSLGLVKAAATPQPSPALPPTNPAFLPSAPLLSSAEASGHPSATNCSVKPKTSKVLCPAADVPLAPTSNKTKNTVKEETFPILVKDVEGAKHRVRVTATTTVRTLKEQMSSLSGISTANMNLCFLGRSLHDHATMQDASVKEGNTVQLISKYLGGTWAGR